MATRLQKQEAENLRKQLTAAVRSIQWSYAIFWSPTTETGELQWGEGYYNGDIKTIKTILAMELNSNQIGCQRSDQLRELYESLLTNESDLQTRRPSAALSPEDLTNAEWYYLVCMSFVFSPGQGLPGRSLANGQPIWLCNAHCADTGVFSRSLLAKSAGIKTVVCFPFLSGVIELGVTELVLEDRDLIQHVKTTLLDISSPFLSRKTNALDQFSSEILHNDLPPLMQGEDPRLVSPSGSSNGFEPVQPANNSILVEGLNGEASQPQSWYLMDDDELSNCVPTSMTSSDCISQTFLNPENAPPSPRTEVTNDTNLHGKDLQDLNRDHLREDLHYQNVLSSLFNKSDPLILGHVFHNLDKGSSFISWKKGGGNVGYLGSPQKILKRILFEVPRMHSAHSLDPKEEIIRKDKQCKQKMDEPHTNHVIAERRRREKVNERFSALKSLIPSSKADKVSILDDTISYLKELERRVVELESCQKLPEYEIKNKRKPQDIEERTSDNYGNDVNDVIKNKRKAREIDEDCSIDNTVIVRMAKKDVLIDIRYPWRESLLLEIINTMSNLHLDSHSVQSSMADGILSVTMKSRLKGGSSLSVGMISETLHRVLRNY